MAPALLLLLLLPLCSGKVHSGYQGTVMTYYPLFTHPNTSVTVEVRFKSNSKSCVINDYTCPPEGCHTVSHKTVTIDKDSTGDFCQMESIWTRNGPTNAPILMRSYKWSSVSVNGSATPQASTLVELRSRSDTGQTNASPQTTVLPVYRVPWNCQRDFHLLNFDPDEDLVQCRFADSSKEPKECNQCRPPSVLSLSPTCTMSFSPSDSSSMGLYTVELMMEDFPRADMVLTHTDGTQEARKTTDSISRIAIQFLLSVEASAPSCSSGLYLPQFVEPTPAHGAQINAQVNVTLQIFIQAQASMSTIDKLWFSGPSGMTESSAGGQYVLSWAPSAGEDGRGFPVCFMAEAVLGSAKYDSDPRCVIVNVRNESTSTISTFTTSFESTSAMATTEDLTIADDLTTATTERKRKMKKRGGGAAATTQSSLSQPQATNSTAPASTRSSLALIQTISTLSLLSLYF